MGNMEQLLIEMVSGNESLISLRYSNHFGVIEGIYRRSVNSQNPTTCLIQ